MDNDIIDRIIDHAREYGVRVDEIATNDDETATGTTVARVKLSVGRNHATFDAIYDEALSPSTLALRLRSLPGTRTLMLAPRVSSRTAARLRDWGANFLDANGNAYLRFGDVVIDVRGRTGEIDASRYSLTPSGTNLFSAKRAQVIFSLISWPQLVNQVLKDLAAVAEVSIGAAQSTLGMLERAGFIVMIDSGRRGRRLHNVDALIDAWVAAYPAGLGSRERALAFRGDLDVAGLEASADRIDLSGEAAAPWIRQPETLTIYTRDRSVPKDAAMAGRWTTRTSEPNIFVRNRFWTPPSEVADNHLPAHRGLRIAPPLIVYADLLASGEPRQRETAQKYRSEHARLRAD